MDWLERHDLSAAAMRHPHELRECHLHLEDSALITSKEAGRTLHALLRAHQIAIYREASERVESSLKGK